MGLAAQGRLRFCFLSCVLDRYRVWPSDPQVSKRTAKGLGVLSLESDTPGLSPGSVNLPRNLPTLCPSLSPHL